MEKSGADGNHQPHRKFYVGWNQAATYRATACISVSIPADGVDGAVDGLCSLTDLAGILLNLVGDAGESSHFLQDDGGAGIHFGGTVMDGVGDFLDAFQRVQHLPCALVLLVHGDGHLPYQVVGYGNLVGNRVKDGVGLGGCGDDGIDGGDDSLQLVGDNL